MSYENTPAPEAVELFDREKLSRRSTWWKALGGVVCSGVLVVGGLASYNYLTRETRPCEKSYDIDPANSPTYRDEVMLPDGQQTNIMVSAFTDSDKPMAQISLGSRDSFSPQITPINDKTGPEMMFNLDDGYTLYADATNSEITIWCGRTVNSNSLIDKKAN